MLITSKVAGAMAEATDRHNDKMQQNNPLFDKSIKLLEAAESLPLTVSSGKLRDKPATIFIRNENGFIKLFVKVKGWQSPPFMMGFWTSHGKQITADLGEFNIWHTRTRARIEKMESDGDL